MAEEQYGDNVFAELPEVWEGIYGRPLVRHDGHPLAAAVWELPPGSDGVDYHYHLGTEEYLVVLRGTATLRTRDGERELPQGSVAHFPPGPDGTHTVVNRSDEPVRYLMVGAHASSDIVVYPDKDEFAAAARGFLVRLPLPPGSRHEAG
jgi:quercetin dioxygenase-like cupin family protein